MERLVIISGLSGSGKSLAAKCLEDIGFFCVDNLPVALIPPFVELLQRSSQPIRNAALVVDVREGIFLEHLPATLRHLSDAGVPFKLLFFEASDDALKRRFSETRRPHPMPGATLEEAIRREREALRHLRDLADRIIDTSSFTSHSIRTFLRGAFGNDAGRRGPNVAIISFGFKFGLPAEADLVFDVRFLVNPFFDETLRPLDGRRPEIKAFLDARPETGAFMRRVENLLDFLIPCYAAEGKTYLTVALGCTGGKHRSVALAEALREYLDGRSVPVAVHHRDLGRE